jgi:hypothetical protein
MGLTQEERRRPQGNMAMEPFAVRPAEAARLIGTSRASIYRLMALGLLDAVKFGSATLVLTASLRQYLSGLPRFIERPEKVDAT